MENLIDVHRGGDYDSAFESESETELRRNNVTSRDTLCIAQTSVGNSVSKASKDVLHQEWSKEEGRNQRFHLLSLDAYTRHKKLINEYILCYPGATSVMKRDTQNDKTERDILKANHKFLWSEEDETEAWEQRLAKKYYDKLFKEYCIADLSRFRENKIAMRWRIEAEVVSGKGQFICGNKSCNENESLKSWEVNFAYLEDNEKKNALVKLRLCPECSYKLNYKHQKKEAKKKRKLNDNSADTPKKLKTIDPIEVEREKNANGRSATEDEDHAKESVEEIWKEPLKTVEEKSKDEEFEDYLADMLM